MKIDKKQPSLHFTDIGANDFTEAVNFVQKAYIEYMTPAWEAAKNGDPDLVAKRGFAFAIGTGAFHLYLTYGAPSSVEDMMEEVIPSIVAQMREQDAKKQREEDATAKA